MNAYDQTHKLTGVDIRLSSILILAAVRLFAASKGKYKVRFTEGLRSRERQMQLIREKKSWTENSLHLYGRAIDVALFVDGQLTWDLSHYSKFNDYVQAASEEFSQIVTWGGEWRRKDGVHFQLELLKALR